MLAAKIELEPVIPEPQEIADFVPGSTNQPGQWSTTPAQQASQPAQWAITPIQQVIPVLGLNTPLAGGSLHGCQCAELSTAQRAL